MGGENLKNLQLEGLLLFFGKEYTFLFYRKQVYNENEAQIVKILRKSKRSRGSVSKIKYYFGQKSIFRHYCDQNVAVRIQIQACNVSNECSTHSSQFTSVKVKKISGPISGKVKKIEAQAI